jgi:hypothetical protein
MESLSFTHVKGSNQTANTIDSLTNLFRDLKGKNGEGGRGDREGEERGRKISIHKERYLRKQI